jgi:hypothetical protein
LGDGAEEALEELASRRPLQVLEGFGEEFEEYILARKMRLRGVGGAGHQSPNYSSLPQRGIGIAQ